MHEAGLAADRQNLLRQIAVVVDSLERRDADALLERLPADHERAVRNQLIEIEFESVEPRERDILSRAFCRRMLDELGGGSVENDFATGDFCDIQNDDVNATEELTVASTCAKTTLAAGFASGAAAIGTACAVRLHASEGLESESVEILAEGEAGSVSVGSDSVGNDALEDPVHDQEQAIRISEHVPETLLPLRDVIDSQSLDSLAVVLRQEQAQTVALVVAAMLPEEAAEFITAWPQAEQGEVLSRIAKMPNADPIVVGTVREELMRQLDRFADETARNEEGRGRVQAIVEASQGAAKQDLLGGLADADRELFRQVAVAADQVDPESGAMDGDNFDPHLAAVAFDRFVDLSDSGLSRVFNELKPEVAVLALAGASQPCLSDVLERLPSRVSDDLRSRMEHLGPLRLGDIQRAQLMAVAVSHRLSSSDETTTDSTMRLKLTA